MPDFFDRLQIFNHRAFAMFARGSKVKIAVVGNGGLSDEDQETIANADCVIRFNNYATREGIDYSSDRFKCDMLWTTGDLHSQGSDPRAVCLGIPFPFKCQSMPARIKKWYPKSTALMVNPYWNLQMNMELKTGTEGFTHPFPSIGFTCLWHLKTIFDKVPTFQAQIFIAGFNWYSQQEGKTIQGVIPSRDYDPKKKGHFNHHYVLEAIWMIDNLMSHPSFGFSESCWRILKTIEGIVGKK
jgi:hypothetical protein